MQNSETSLRLGLNPLMSPVDVFTFSEKSKRSAPWVEKDPIWGYHGEGVDDDDEKMMTNDVVMEEKRPDIFSPTKTRKRETRWEKVSEKDKEKRWKDDFSPSSTNDVRPGDRDMEGLLSPKGRRYQNKPSFVRKKRSKSPETKKTIARDDTSFPFEIDHSPSPSKPFNRKQLIFEDDSDEDDFFSGQ